MLEVNKLQLLKVVVHMPQKTTLTADAITDDIYASIDAVYDKLERQITDWKKLLIKSKRYSSSNFIPRAKYYLCGISSSMGG